MIVKRQKQFNERKLIKNLIADTVVSNIPVLGPIAEVESRVESNHNGDWRNTLTNKMIKDADKLSETTEERVSSILDKYKDQLTPETIEKIKNIQSKRDNISKAAKKSAKILKGRAIPYAISALPFEGLSVFEPSESMAEELKLRQKQYGRKWEGFKGALEGAGKGALVGAGIGVAGILAEHLVNKRRNKRMKMYLDYLDNRYERKKK